MEARHDRAVQQPLHLGALDVHRDVPGAGAEPDQEQPDGGQRHGPEHPGADGRPAAARRPRPRRPPSPRGGRRTAGWSRRRWAAPATAPTEAASSSRPSCAGPEVERVADRRDARGPGREREPVEEEGGQHRVARGEHLPGCAVPVENVTRDTLSESAPSTWARPDVRDVTGFGHEQDRHHLRHLRRLPRRAPPRHRARRRPRRPARRRRLRGRAQRAQEGPVAGLLPGRAARDRRRPQAGRRGVRRGEPRAQARVHPRAPRPTSW